MTRQQHLGLILLMLIILSSAAPVSHGGVLDEDSYVYKSATEYDYPPFSVTENGVADGFSVELLKAVAEEIGIEVSFKIDEWQTIKKELEVGELDILPLVGRSEEREAVYDFTIPYIVMRGNIFVRDDNETIRSEKDLFDKQIIVMAGDNSEEYARRIGLTENLILAKTYTEAFEMLSGGQYDAVLAQGLVGEKIINDMKLDNVQPLYTYGEDGQSRLKVNLSGYEQKFCFAVKEGNDELLAKLNEGLAVVSENGTYDKLYTKWFPFLVDESPSLTQILTYSMMLIIPLVIMILFTAVITVRKQVKSKTEELTVSLSNLSFERNKYYATLLSIQDSVILINNRGMVEIINPTAQGILEVSEEEAVGVHYSKIINFFAIKDSGLRVDPVAEVIEEASAYQPADDFFVLQLSVGSSGHYVKVKASPIYNEANNLVDVVLVFSDVSKEKAYMNQIEYLSFHDSLTDLYNRRFFEEEMKRLDTPRSYPLTILMADLNGLKLINDAFGHLVGDEMLKTAARILRQECRESDIISRWGGDEFVILLENTPPRKADEIVKRIDEACKREIFSFGALSMAFGHDSKIDVATSVETIFKNAEEYMYKQKLSKTEGTRGETIRVILNTLFQKSPRDKEHCERVSELGVLIANEMGLHQSQVADIRSIGLLHDIGKIIIPQSILDKPDKLTREEYEEIKKHPLIGYRILSAANEFSHLARGVLYHHERVDGKGYPNGISGDEIPLEAKIIFIADAYDAMTAQRPYRTETLSKAEAAQEIMNNAGTQFDEAIAGIFVNRVLGSD